MNIASAQASHFIVNQLTGRQARFAKLFRTTRRLNQRVVCVRAGHV
jgi:hypothetical protein